MNDIRNEIQNWVFVLEVCEQIEKKFKNKKSEKANKEAQKALKKYINLIGTEFGD